jgi:ATP-dependent DNA helicase RecQ
MVENRPQTLDQLSNTSGVGKRKLADYGEAFLEILNEYRNLEESTRTDTEEETLQLFRIGMHVDAIAAQRGLKTTTVYNHLAKGIECGEVSLNEVVRLQPQQLDSIRFAIEQSDSGKRLKPVFDALEGEYSYEILRCVRSDMAR